jgi:hypothetical protein
MKGMFYGIAALAVVVGCGGLSTSATTDAGGDAPHRTADSGTDVSTLDTTTLPLPEASTDDASEATTSKRDAAEVGLARAVAILVAERAKVRSLIHA